MRNVADHLPKHLRPWFQAKIRKAWNADRADVKRHPVLRLRRHLLLRAYRLESALAVASRSWLVRMTSVSAST